jgi:hypothetical protein
MAMKFIIYLKALYIRFKGRPAALRRAIKRADRRCRKNKKRYRVFFIENKYQSFSRAQVQMKKHKKQWSRDVNVTKMEPMSFYDTLIGIQPAGCEVLKNK